MRSIRIIAWGALLLAGLSSTAQAFYGLSFGIDPHLDWKTITTPHFRVTYAKENIEMAKRSSVLLEEAHALLAPRLYWEPRTRTQVTILDSTDAANGLTSAALRFGIILFATPPESWFSTAYTDDWLRLLILHEYTHLLNMDVTEDWSEALRWVFGDAIRPNGLWQPWMLEGLAVYMETRLTPSGRGRSSFYEAILRSAVAEKKLRDPSWFSFNRLGGTNPWPPGGEGSYFFGFQLMSQVARDADIAKKGITADGKNRVTGGEDGLGLMSRRSGSRIPFFINGNLENITGRDWADYWERFLSETELRMGKELERLRSRPVTEPTVLAAGGHSPASSAVSPDGKKIAYSIETPDEEAGLYVRDLPSGKTKRLRDKVMGIGMSFSPDGKTILASELRREDNYRLFSDLIAVDAESGSRRFLTHALRAKDPDVSRDGKRIAFARAVGNSMELAIADLTADGDSFRIGSVRSAFRGGPYDRVANPKFSLDGKTIYFTLHRSGENEIQLYAWNSNGSARAILSDGFRNRFPAVDGGGRLYFISDRTGVDNLYRFEESGRASLLTNVVGALWLPGFGPESAPGRVFASSYSSDGWNLAAVPLSSKPLDSKELTVQGAPPLAKPDAEERRKAERDSISAETTTDSYSIFPSIYPRAWAPYLTIDSFGARAGGQVAGFDALDFHRYSLFGTYDTQLKLFEGVLDYTYRGLGPLLSVRAAHYTNGLYLRSDGSVAYYQRRVLGAASAAFPFLFTRSSLVPEIAAQIEQERMYAPSRSPELVSTYRFLPSVSGGLTYSFQDSSRLAVAPEQGFTANVASRLYFDAPKNTLKHFASWTQYLNPAQHVVLIPSVSGAVAQRASAYEDANVLVKSRSLRLVKTSLGPGDSSLDEMLVRGYSNLGTLRAKWAAEAALDVRVPVFRFFRGFGTFPFYLENLYATAFGEGTRARSIRDRNAWLPSAGGGLRLATELFTYLPLTFTVEYQRGFNQSRGAKGEVIGAVLVPGLPF